MPQLLGKAGEMSVVERKPDKVLNHAEPFSGSVRGGVDDPQHSDLRAFARRRASRRRIDASSWPRCIGCGSRTGTRGDSFSIVLILIAGCDRRPIDFQRPRLMTVDSMNLLLKVIATEPALLKPRSDFALRRSNSEQQMFGGKFQGFRIVGQTGSSGRNGNFHFNADQRRPASGKKSSAGSETKSGQRSNTTTVSTPTSASILAARQSGSLNRPSTSSAKPMGDKMSSAEGPIARLPRPRDRLSGKPISGFGECPFLVAQGLKAASSWADGFHSAVHSSKAITGRSPRFDGIRLNFSECGRLCKPPNQVLTNRPQDVLIDRNQPEQLGQTALCRPPVFWDTPPPYTGLIAPHWH